MEVRDLQKEIKELESSRDIKLLDITTMEGVLTRSAVETTLDAVRDTLDKINLDEIAASVSEDLKGFAESV